MVAIMTISPIAFALDTLSRLKGIETAKKVGYHHIPFPFGYAFPFEGN